MSDTTVLIMSDTHGNSMAIEQLLNDYKGRIATVVHLGDHVDDMLNFIHEDTITYHIVSGNTDSFLDIFDERVIELIGKRIFITHGHMYDVKEKLDNLIFKTLEMKVDACLFGHTHVPVLFSKNDTIFLNPGSLAYSSTNTERGYALLRISQEGVVTGNLLAYKPSDWPVL